MSGTSGRLTVCPTPLGNLKDVSLRVLDALKECDIVFAEDTRVTRALLAHYGIHKPLRSSHGAAEAARARELRAALEAGRHVALCTDAGMPGVSDPGAVLVREARACGARVDVLPGPSVVTSALVLSGFPSSSFRFMGFAPRTSRQRCALFESLRFDRAVSVWCESPRRVAAFLADLAAVLPERRVFILREYTKKFEEQIAGTARELAQTITGQLRGEVTVVVEGSHDHTRPGAAAGDAVAAVVYLRRRGLSMRDAVEAIRLATGAARNDLYRLAVREAKKQD